MTKPFQPANGTEGIDFIACWCARCQCEPEDIEEDEADGCPILGASFALKVSHKDYPSQLIADDDGENPRCTAFIERTQPGVVVDPYAVQRARVAYDALPRDPVTGRPIIA